MKKKNKNRKKKGKDIKNIFQSIKRYGFHPDINCLPLLSPLPSYYYQRDENHYSLLLLASRITNLVGSKKSLSLAGVV